MMEKYIPPEENYIPYEKRKLEQIVNRERKVGNIIILAGGSFEIFQPHPTHIKFLKECKKIGNKYRDNLLSRLEKLGKLDTENNEYLVKLFVNVVNDDRVRKYEKKGSVSRPFITQENRAMMVSSLDGVDYTTVHPWIGNPKDEKDIGPTERLAKIIKPDLIIKGKGWKRGEKKKIREFLDYNVELDDILIDGEGEALSSTKIYNYVGKTTFEMSGVSH